MRPIKIAQICSSHAWGGMEMHVSQLSSDLMDRGQKCMVFCAPQSPLYNDALERNLEIRSFAPKGYFSPRSCFALARQLVDEKVDIIHAHYSRDLWTIVPALNIKKLSKMPLVFIKHIGTQKPKRDPIHKWLYGRVCKMIAISEVIAKNLSETHPVAQTKIKVLHHGVELSAFDSALGARERTRSQLGFEPTHFVIGNIGRLQIGKGHLEFIEMAKKIHKEFPFTRFLVIGEPTRGEEFRAQVIYDALEQSGIKDSFVMTGYRKDIPDLLAAMDLFAFPSRAEAFGLVVIEAMAARLPVVSCKSDGILDIIDDGVQGLLVPPQDSMALTNAVHSLLLDVQKRLSLADHGRRRVEKDFSRDVMLDRLLALYEECLRSTRRF